MCPYSGCAYIFIVFRYDFSMSHKCPLKAVNIVEEVEDGKEKD